MINVNGEEIKLDQIIKYENFNTGEIKYYYVGTGSFNYMWLFKYNKIGELDNDSLDNIKIDKGVGLVNDNIGEWTVLGIKEEVYNKIFNR